MKAVPDASAGIAVALRRREADPFSSILAEADLVLAPALFVPEVVNTIWKFHQFEHLGLDLCDRTLEAALGLVDAFVPTKEIHAKAFLLARATRRPAYDMFYLALARREDALFLTTDRALRKEAQLQNIRME